MFKILDRYLVREIVPPLLLGLVGADLPADDPADSAERRAAHRQGRRLVDHGPRAADAAAPGAEPHDPDGAAARHSVRPRPAVGRPRVRGDAGVRRQPLPADAPDCAPRRRWRPPATAYETIVALPDANQTFREITFNVVAVRRGEQRQAARVLQDFPEPRALRPRRPAGRRLARRLPRRHDPARSDDGVFRAAGAAGDRPRQAKVELVLENGTLHTTYAESPKRTTGPFERHGARLDADAVFPRTPVVKGDNEMIDRRAAPDRRRERRSTASPTTASAT